jgi:precorrin-6A/cobalt-precorrin-6A reductase
VKVLLLAGTTEARALTDLLTTTRPDVDLTISYAGHTRRPPFAIGTDGPENTGAPDPGGAGEPGGDGEARVRLGGFGGAEGLAAEVRQEGYDAIVDATHPFAAVMPWHAAAAADAVDIPRLRLLRPPWEPSPGDTWLEVADLAAAPDALRKVDAHRVLLTTGRLELAPFRPLSQAGVEFVLRSIEPPDPQPLLGATVVLARPPFTVADEIALLHDHRIDTVVTKNSGGTSTAAKLTAARRVGLPLVMVTRPPTPAGPLVETPAEAVAWLESLSRP